MPWEAVRLSGIVVSMHGGRESTNAHVYVRVRAVVKPDLHCAKTMCELQKEAGRWMTADTAFYPAPAGRREPEAEYLQENKPQGIHSSLCFQSKHIRDPHINSNHQ